MIINLVSPFRKLPIINRDGDESPSSLPVDEGTEHDRLLIFSVEPIYCHSPIVTIWNTSTINE